MRWPWTEFRVRSTPRDVCWVSETSVPFRFESDVRDSLVARPNRLLSLANGGFERVPDLDGLASAPSCMSTAARWRCWCRRSTEPALALASISDNHRDLSCRR